MSLSPIQFRIAKLVATGKTYPFIAAVLAGEEETQHFNARLTRHHADVAARKLLPHSKLPTRQRLAVWWERRHK